MKSLDQFNDHKIDIKGTDRQEEFQAKYEAFKYGIQKQSSKTDWADEISNQENKSIELGIADADNGRLKSNSEAKNIYGKGL
ncbi:hypothetical protein ERX46_06320 [Brumimicrobium glaciale]|uniref:Uncharacterized protein n=1 Tax=Brumimicrobium glaciale TaxID=200475 RepID=A0A4Q4KNK5_9FLAO|nr:hypothetical protein [Brumimicrobium glaciale]RYM34985.1 hypothetical protein ERX46_06320 [Brumimicrobium glaciale]